MFLFAYGGKTGTLQEKFVNKL